MQCVEVELIHFRASCTDSHTSKCSQKQKSLVTDDLQLKRFPSTEVFFEHSMWLLMLLAAWGNAGKRERWQMLYSHIGNENSEFEAHFVYTFMFDFMSVALLLLFLKALRTGWHFNNNYTKNYTNTLPLYFFFLYPCCLLDSLLI